MIRALQWCIALLALIVAGWFAFDGAHALLTGDYVTPSSGPYAGQLGPWSSLVLATGVDPRSELMKSVFVGYGVAWLVVIGAFLLRRPWAWAGMMAAAIASLWYLPFGTLLGLIQIALLLLPPVRAARPA